MEKPSTTQLNVSGVQVILSHVRLPSFVFRPPVTSRPVVRLFPGEREKNGVALIPAICWEKSKSTFIASPILPRSRAQSSGLGAMLAYN